MFEFVASNWQTLVSILAILTSPIVALWVSQKAADKKEKRDRQLQVLTELMATRRARLDYRHISALNLVELEFYNNSSIRMSYKNYIENLSVPWPVNEKDQSRLWDQRNDLFAVLLRDIANSLGYAYDKSDLSRLGYSPEAHGILGENQMANSVLIRNLLEGKTALQIKNTDANQADIESSSETLKIGVEKEKE